jgi:hypothetical protein
VEEETKEEGESIPLNEGDDWGRAFEDTKGGPTKLQIFALIGVIVLGLFLIVAAILGFYNTVDDSGQSLSSISLFGLGVIFNQDGGTVLLFWFGLLIPCVWLLARTSYSKNPKRPDENENSESSG